MCRLKPSLPEEYAESESAWNYALHEIADSTDPLERICVAEDETGAVIGLCMGGPPKAEILPNSGEVYALFVLPGHQGRGIGQTLVRAVAAHLEEMGMSSQPIDT